MNSIEFEIIMYCYSTSDGKRWAVVSCGNSTGDVKTITI